MSWSSRVMKFRFDGRTQLQMCLLLYRPTCWCLSGWAPTWPPHTKLHKFGWNTFPNNAWMKNRTDLNVGKVVYISIIFHIPVSWLNLLNGYDFYIWCRDTANQSFTVTDEYRIFGLFFFCTFLYCRPVRVLFSLFLLIILLLFLVYHGHAFLCLLERPRRLVFV